MTSNFDRFRNFQNSGLSQKDNQHKKFLTESKSSFTVLHVDRSESITAVLTNSYKEGGDEFIMFTENLAATDENVKIGDYIEHDDKSFLVYNEYNHPMKRLWLKHQLIECNQTVSFGTTVQPVYYVSSLRRFVDTKASSGSNLIALESGSKAMLITKDSEDFVADLRFMIIDELFEIVEVDRKSNPGIAYISIEPTTAMSQDDLVGGYAHPVPESVPVTVGAITLPGVDENEISGGKILAGSTVTDTTYGGFVQFSTPVKILSRTATLVTWEAPMRAIEELTVTVKDQTDTQIKIFYKVVI